MIELLLNRSTGYALLRWSPFIEEHMGTPDRNDVRLIFDPKHLPAIRAFLTRNSHRIENAEGILRMLGN